MLKRKLTIGTRGSALALWQANYIKDRLQTIGVASELKIIKTQGDIVQHLRLDKLEGKGFFTKELEEELLSSQIDLAVHSHKDLPTVNPPGLVIAAVSEREDPSELLIIRKEALDITQKLSLKEKAKVGTSSNRRKAQLLSFRADLDFADLRGNIQTRVQKLRDEQYDAIMLAKAGIERVEMDLSDFHVEVVPPIKIIPAPAQGVLAVQIRETDQELYEMLQPINDAAVQETIAVERKILNLFDAGCHAPLGAYCRKHQGQFEVWTSVAEDNEEFPDRLFVRAETTAGLADQIFAQFQKDRALPKSVYITRDLDEKGYLSRFLAKHDIAVEGQSLIRIYPTMKHLDSFILKHADWLFFGSKNAIEHFFKLEPYLMKKTKIAVLGQGSEQALRKYDRVADFSGDQIGVTAEEFAVEFAKIANGTKVVIPCAKETMGTVRDALSADTEIVSIPVYETVQVEEVDKSNAQVLIFTSPSNVEAYFRHHLLDPGQKVISIGTSTGKKFDEMGIPYVIPFSPDEVGLAEAVFGIPV